MFLTTVTTKKFCICTVCSVITDAESAPTLFVIICETWLVCIVISLFGFSTDSTICEFVNWLIVNNS